MILYYIILYYIILYYIILYYIILYYIILYYTVKQCIQVLKKPLANIYNANPESVIFPDQLNIARVVLLYKKEDTRDIQNYRPIALLSVFFKIAREIGVCRRE